MPLQCIGLCVVVAMKRLKPRGKFSFASKVIQALGRDSGFKLPFTVREKKPTGVSAYHVPYVAHNEFKNALLEAERLKGKSILEIQRHNSLR